MDRQSFIEHASHERSHWWFQARRKIVQAILDQLSQPIQGQTQWLAKTPPSVFEIGCGTGATVKYLSSRFRVAGADISHHAIGFAQESYPECSFVAYSELAEIASHILDADVILLLDVLEHIDDDFHFLSQLISLMRPGAYLLLSVPHDPRLWSEHDEALFHFRRYDVARLRCTWEGLPVAEALLTGLNYRLAPLIRWTRWATSRRPKPATFKPRSNLSQPNPLFNKVLFNIFGGEASQLARSLQTRRSGQDFSTAAISLLAVLQRIEGTGFVRAKPTELVDQHRPKAFDLGNDTELASTP